MIAAGTAITLTVKGSTGEWIPRTVDDVRQGAINSMSAYVTVESVGVTRKSTSIFRELWDYGYDATVRIRTRVAHNSIDDIIGIVRSAFESSTGETPTVTADGFGFPQSGGTGGTNENPSMFGIGLGVFGLAAIAVAIFVWKKS